MIHHGFKEYFLSSKSSLSTSIQSPQENYPEHAHSFDELVIINSGFGMHVLNDIPMNLSKNYVCFVKSKDRHLFEGVNRLYLSNVIFRRDKLGSCPIVEGFVKNKFDKYDGWFINDSSMKNISYIIDRLNEETQINNLESRVLSQSLFQLLVVELCRGRIGDIRFSSVPDKILYAINFVNTEFSNIDDINYVCDLVELSPKKLTNNIKKMTGMTFSQYLHFTKTSRALSQMLYTDKLVTDIALDVGYNDSNYFSTRFKQIFKTTPSNARINPSDIILPKFI